MHREQTDFQKQIDRYGGCVFSGLYHGKRRVRAKFTPLDNTWVLCSSEADLIKALGTSKIGHDVSVVDLRKKHGLHIRDEIVPVEVKEPLPEQYEVLRTDEWGEKAKLYIDSRSFSEKFYEFWSSLTSKDIPLIILILLFFPFSFGAFVSEQLSVLLNKIISAGAIVATLVSVAIVGILDIHPHLNNLEETKLFLLLLYFSLFFLPFIIYDKRAL